MEIKLKMKKIVTLLVLFISANSFAQNIEFTKDNFKDNKEELKEAKKNIEKGDELFALATVYYKQALDPYYLAAQKFNPNNALLNYKIGKCYLYSNYKLKSIPYLEKALELNAAVDPQIHYLLGKAYHLNMEFDKAIKAFQTFQQTLKGEELALILADVNVHISQCLTGKEMVKNPVRVFIDNVGAEINSQFPDYSPVISADESVMLFTSRRTNSTGGKIDPEINENFEDIYISTRKDGKWSPAINMGSPINTDNHDANSGLSADGQKFLIYIGNNNGDLYESELKGDKWLSLIHI
jgi:tetratricopeptide (TPR) repeat protein